MWDTNGSLKWYLTMEEESLFPSIALKSNTKVQNYSIFAIIRKINMLTSEKEDAPK